MFFKLKNHKYTVLFFSPSACDSVRLETKNKTNTKQPFLSVRLLDKHRLNSQSSSLDVPFSKQRWLQAVLNIVVYTISLHYINPVIRQCFATCQPCIIIQLNMFKNTLCQKNTCHLSVLQSKHRHSASLKKRILLLLPVNNPHAVIRQSWQTSRSNDEWRAWHPEASWQVQRVQKLKIHCTAEQSFGGFPVYAGRRFSEGRTSRG